jgi:RNase P/RNase MRP subunit POP5
MLSLFGEVTVAEARFYLNEYDEAAGIGYFQCNSAQLDNVVAAAVLLESIEDTKVCFVPIKTSGTIKALHRS